VRWHGNGTAGESDTLTLAAATKNRDECEASRTQVAVGPLREWPRDFSESFRAMPSDIRRHDQGDSERREPITFDVVNKRATTPTSARAG